MNYWVVGAMWGGEDDALEDFIRRGYWYCWDPRETKEEAPGPGNSIGTQQLRFRQIQRGDRIAVKKMLGKDAPNEIEIRAIGIVTDKDESEWRVYVKWLDLESLPRRVAIHGCQASIHGPFSFNGADKEWVREVFCV